MDRQRRIVIVGATSAIAEHCARLWLCEQAADVTLVGRDATRLQRVADDLRVRSPRSTLRTLTAEFVGAEAIEKTVRDIVAAGTVDIVLIAHGLLPQQEACEQDLALCGEALAINSISPALYAEAFARQLASSNRGTLILIGSVAGDRGRKSNYVYGAAKGLLARYAEGLQHRFAATPVKVVLVKPGPTDTPMTAALKARGVKLASPEEVAQRIVTSAERGKRVIYAPARWRLIMWTIRHMPFAIFGRLDI